MAFRDDVKGRQHRMNMFTDKYLKGVGRIKEDGEMGPATRQRLHDVQWWAGYLPENIGAWSDKLDRSLIHPFDRRNTSAGTVARGVERRKVHNLDYYTHHLRTGVGTFDGIPVCNCAIPILQWCRENDWPGRLASGHRTAAYSTYLCYRMCNRPSCPGTCAGASTNHTGTTCERFAVDVTDYQIFGQVVARCPLSPKLYNHLPHDLVHYSPSGF